MHLLSLMILLPIVAGLSLLMLPNSLRKVSKVLALITTATDFVLSLLMYLRMSKGTEAPVGIRHHDFFQFVEKYEWIHLDLGSYGKVIVEFFVGIDGLNIALVMLTTFLFLIANIASWRITYKQRFYFALFLFLMSAVIGSLVALDFFLFFLCFEFMLLPMYFLISMWGGKKRDSAALKFLIYTLVGSVMLLAGGVMLSASVIDPVRSAQNTGWLQANEEDKMVIELFQEHIQKNSTEIPQNKLVHTFNMTYMTDAQNYIPNSLLAFSSYNKPNSFTIRHFVFLLLLIGFAVKIPIFPFHTWLPDAHTEASTPISVVLAGILLKVGSYGILRMGYAIFADVVLDFSYWIGFFAVVSIIYGGMVALGQTHFKRLIAYSSISHMGFVMLGIASVTPEGINGAIFQMVSHGLISAFLFLVAGVLYERTQNLEIEAYGGIYTPMPRFTAFASVGFFAALGLPAFSGFVGELFILIGGFKTDFLPKSMTMIAITGLIIAAGYCLWVLKRMFLGTYWVRADINPEAMKDLDYREKILFTALLVMIIYLGIYPQPLFDTMVASTSFLADSILRFLR